MPQKLIYVTVENTDEGLRIGRAMVEERLAACANVLPGATSVFRWEGRVQTESEAILVLKTAALRTEAAVARIKALHGYSCPCVVVLAIESGNSDFLAWIDRETDPAGES